MGLDSYGAGRMCMLDVIDVDTLLLDAVDVVADFGSIEGVGESPDVVLEHRIIAMVIGILENESTMLVILEFLVKFLCVRIYVTCFDGEEIGWDIVLFGLDPIIADAFSQSRGLGQSPAFHREEVEEGGHIGGSHLVARDNLVEACDGHLLECLRIGQREGDEFIDLGVELVLVPLRVVVGRRLVVGIITAKNIEVLAVGLESERLEVV